MAKSKPNPRNQHRGTRLTQLRLREETLAAVSRIQARLSGPHGANPCSVTDAIRYAITRTDAEISTAKNAGNPSVSAQSGK